MSILETEGIVYQEEGIPASIGFRDFRALGRLSSYRRSWFSGSMVLTKLHFLVFAGAKTMIGIAWDDEKLGALSCTMDEKSRLADVLAGPTVGIDVAGSLAIYRPTPHLARISHSEATIA
jgi:hypothetical protein